MKFSEKKLFITQSEHLDRLAITIQTSNITITYKIVAHLFDSHSSREHYTFLFRYRLQLNSKDIQRE